MKLNAKQKERLVNQIGKRIVEANWHWRGTQFSSFGWCGVTTHTSAYVRITAAFKYLKVNVETENEFNIPNQVRMFAGEDAMTDAVNWIADSLIELHNKLSERVAPYVDGFNKYQNAIQGR